MFEHWQTWLAALLCIAAGAYVLRRVWLAFGVSKYGCGSGCSSCAAKPGAAQPLQQISIDQERPS
jgi:hypothetical protein